MQYTKNANGVDASLTSHYLLSLLVIYTICKIPIMRNVYLYLDSQQKQAIKKIAYNKKLSMSAVVEIIFKHYGGTSQENYYIHKGSAKTKIHLREMDLWDKGKPMDMWVNNSIQNWFINKKENNFANRKIQSELDKKKGTDPYWNYNEMYRILHRYKKEQKK